MRGLGLTFALGFTMLNSFNSLNQGFLTGGTQPPGGRGTGVRGYVRTFRPDPFVRGGPEGR